MKPASSSRLLLLAVGGLGFSAVITQLALLREMLGALAGNEMVLGIVLGNWLLLTGLGTALGRAVAKGQPSGGAAATTLDFTGKTPFIVIPSLRGIFGILRQKKSEIPRKLGMTDIDGCSAESIFLIGLMLVAVLPLAQVVGLRVLRNMVFVRGAIVGVSDTVLASFVLLLPYCLVSGLLLTLACALLADQEGHTAIGRVYVADSIGSVAGGAIVGFVLVRWLDHCGMLYVPALLNLVLAGGLARQLGRPRLLAAAAAVAVLVGGLMIGVDLDAVSTARQYPGQRILFRKNSPYGKLLVTESAGQLNFIENGVLLVAMPNVEQVEETVHYAMAQRPDAGEVLLVGGAVSGTAREILKYRHAAVTYVELDPLIITAGRRYLPGNLADGRLTVVNTDGRLFVEQTDKKFAVVIVDLPDPSTSQLNRFFTAEFFRAVRRVLAKDGVVSFALGRYENYVSPQLGRLLAVAYRTVHPFFRNVLVLPGSRVFFVASNGALTTGIAGRLERHGVATQLVNRHYLDAMLTADRLGDLERAVAGAGPVNRDFTPVLYFEYLRYWLSQFRVSGGLVAGGLLIALAIYLVRIRPVPLAIFVSGFAASALEVVLLLGFQILCGAVYQQVTVIVTAFMAGLAVGAWGANRLQRTATAASAVCEGFVIPSLRGISGILRRKKSEIPRKLGMTMNKDFSGEAELSGNARRTLAGLALAIAGFALLVPLVLPALGRIGGATVGLAATRVVVTLLAFVLAVLVGLEFPVAARVESGGVAAIAGRLYTADFVGACLGALLASAFLIPLLGVTAVCWLTAGLNLSGGAAVWRSGRAVSQ